MEQIDNGIPQRLKLGFVNEHGFIPAIYTLKKSIAHNTEFNSIYDFLEQRKDI